MLKSLCSLVVLTVMFALPAAPAQAGLVNLDITGLRLGDDSYGPGVGVFGSATSVWNHTPRTITNFIPLALLDDTGAVSGVTVSYNRTESGSADLLTGAFAALGVSNIETREVTLAGLIPGSEYDLVVYVGWDGIPQITAYNPDNLATVRTKAITPTSDWNTLTAGANYVQFSLLASNAGELVFFPTGNPTGTSGRRMWSAFQLQSTPTTGTVPEPGSAALLVLALLACISLGRRARA